MKKIQISTRRRFLARAGLLSASPLLAPNILTAQKSGAGQVIVGEGAHRYEVHHGWAKLPEKFTKLSN